MPKHSARRNIRGGVAAGAVLAAVTLTAGVAYANASPGPLPTCADALTAYNTAAANQATDKTKLDAANAESDSATNALATARQADATEDTAKPDDPAKPDASDLAKSAAESRAFRAGEGQSSAQHTYDADVTATAAAKSQVDKPVSDGGCAGVPGPKGVNAKIVLSPGVCAEATVTSDPAKLVRVVMLVPCPPVVPPAPPVAPAPGQDVTVVSPAAPAPQVQEAHLPVTH